MTNTWRWRVEYFAEETLLITRRNCPAAVTIPAGHMTTRARRLIRQAIYDQTAADHARLSSQVTQ